MSERPKYYSIGHVARMTDLPTHTIRYWETMFSQLAPKKNRAGRRMYTKEDVRVVEVIQDLLHNRHFTIKGAQEALENGVPLVAGQAQEETHQSEDREEILERVRSVKNRLQDLISELKAKP